MLMSTLFYCFWVFDRIVIRKQQAMFPPRAAPWAPSWTPLCCLSLRGQASLRTGISRLVAQAGGLRVTLGATFDLLISNYTFHGLQKSLVYCLSLRFIQHEDFLWSFWPDVNPLTFCTTFTTMVALGRMLMVPAIHLLNVQVHLLLGQKGLLLLLLIGLAELRSLAEAS